MTLNQPVIHVIPVQYDEIKSRLNQSFGRIVNKLRRQHTTYPVDLVAELKTFHQTVLDALFYLQTNTDVSTSYSKHVQFVLTYVNSMEVFHDLTEREIDDSGDDGDAGKSSQVLYIVFYRVIIYRNLIHIQQF